MGKEYGDVAVNLVGSEKDSVPKPRIGHRVLFTVLVYIHVAFFVVLVFE